MTSRNCKHLPDEALVDLLKQGERSAFEEIYHRYWPRLHSFTYKRTHSQEITEELVQDIFTKLWLQRAQLVIHVSLPAYLFTAMKHLVLDHLQREMVRKNYRDFLLSRDLKVDNSTEERVLHHDLVLTLEAGIHQLPPKCRFVFQLSRQEELSMKEIAARLAISEKTVENHLSKALRMLRLSLKDFLPAILLSIFSQS